MPRPLPPEPAPDRAQGPVGTVAPPPPEWDDDAADGGGLADAPAWQRLLWYLAAALSCAVLVTSASGWTAAHLLGASLGRVDAFAGLQERPVDDGALNFLVVGVDRRDGVPPGTLEALHAGGASCDCTDTIMLVHVPEDRSGAQVVSIPRDSYVPIPAHRDRRSGAEVPAGHGKINAAYTLGGPPLTVQTVEQATGVRIDHYLEIDFLGFVETVDALGGVTVSTDRPLRDAKSGLDLPAGTHLLDGAEALSYVRARQVDPTADFGRMERQQHLLRGLLDRMLAQDVLLDPARMGEVAGTLLGAVTADGGLRPQDLVDLARQMGHLTGDDATFVTVPVADDSYQAPGWGSTVLWDRAAAEELFAAVREDRPLPVPSGTAPAAGTGTGTAPAGGTSTSADAAAAPGPAATVGRDGAPLTVRPEEVHLRVLNGTGVAGLGARADAQLRGVGFATSGRAADAPVTGVPVTVVQYDPRWDESVRTLGAALPRARLEPVPGLGATFRVVVGEDWDDGPRPVAVPG
ncbi:LCP family protein [Allostreptomyces psammosilenae]|uniref:LCP family protein required for cell wall assembly n=1 Tax=Allostreptomyces psammosilenae TaxID=1892865 RepID=A0A853A630_9ACTN|nr:LCP family protein [Allostreptomyces psammosilenae]NYI06141.1 LCP family protein required for cell wall assembly [Allostreptomyces psammosilenae]